MCKIWIIKYTCEHELRLRRSECRGTVKIGPKSRTSACGRQPSLRLRATGACGSCQLAAANAALDLEAKTLEPTSPAEAFLCTRFSTERERILNDIEARRECISKQYPSGLNWKAPTTSHSGQKPGERSQAKRRRTSLLSKEVLPSDICGEASWTGDSITDWQSDGGSSQVASYGWEDWGSGYKKLSDEINEDKTSRADGGLPDPCRDQHEGLDEIEDGEEGLLCVDQHSCLDVDSETSTMAASSIEIEQTEKANVSDPAPPTLATYDNNNNDSALFDQTTNACQTFAAQACGPDTTRTPAEHTTTPTVPLTPSTNSLERPMSLLRTPALSEPPIPVPGPSHLESHTKRYLESDRGCHAFAPPKAESQLEESIKIRMKRRQTSHSGKDGGSLRQRSNGRGNWVEDITTCFDWVRVSS